MGKNKGGRPSKYKKQYCFEIIEHMKTGLSLESFAGRIGVSRETIYEWERTRPEFSDACKKARAECQEFWEKVGLNGMTGKIKGFNAAVWIFNMKNRFGWHDNFRTEIGPNNSEHEKELQEALEELKKRQPEAKAKT